MGARLAARGGEHYDVLAEPGLGSDREARNQNGQKIGPTQLLHPSHFHIEIDQDGKEPRMWDARRFRDVFVHFFGFLSLADRCRCAAVSRMWLQACYDPSLWHSLDLSQVRFRLGDDLLTTLLRSSRFKHLEALSVEGCAAISDRSLRAIERISALRTLDISGCEMLSESGVIRMAERLHLDTLRLYDCELDPLVAEPLARLRPRMDTGLLWLQYCAKAGVTGPPGATVEAKCRYIGGFGGRGCWGPVRGVMVYSNQTPGRRRGSRYGNLPSEVLYVCQSHMTANASDTTLFTCMCCLRFFRRPSMCVEQAVCKVCFDGEILREGAKWVSLERLDWKSNLTFQQVINKATHLADRMNIPETLRPYGTSSFHLPHPPIPGTPPLPDGDAPGPPALPGPNAGGLGGAPGLGGVGVQPASSALFTPTVAAGRGGDEKKGRGLGGVGVGAAGVGGARVEEMGRIRVVDEDLLDDDDDDMGYANAWDDEPEASPQADSKLLAPQPAEAKDRKGSTGNSSSITSSPPELGLAGFDAKQMHGDVPPSARPRELAMQDYAADRNSELLAAGGGGGGGGVLGMGVGVPSFGIGVARGNNHRRLIHEEDDGELDEKTRLAGVQASGGVGGEGGRLREVEMERIRENLQEADEAGETRALLFYDKKNTRMEVYADRQAILDGHSDHEAMFLTQKTLRHFFFVLYPFVAVMLIVAYFKVAYEANQKPRPMHAHNNQLSEKRQRDDNLSLILILAAVFFVVVIAIVWMVYRFRATCERLFRKFLVLDILMIYLFGGSSMILIGLHRLQILVGVDTFIFLSWNLAAGGLASLYLKLPDDLRRFYLVCLSAIMAVMMVITLSWMFLLIFLSLAAMMDLASGFHRRLRLFGELITSDRELVPFATPRIFYEVPGLRFRFANLFTYGLLLGCSPMGTSTSIMFSIIVSCIAGLVFCLYIFPYTTTPIPYAKIRVRPLPLSMMGLVFFAFTHYPVIRPYARSINFLYPFEDVAITAFS